MPVPVPVPELVLVLVLGVLMARTTTLVSVRPCGAVARVSWRDYEVATLAAQGTNPPLWPTCVTEAPQGEGPHVAAEAAATASTVRLAAMSASTNAVVADAAWRAHADEQPPRRQHSEVARAAAAATAEIAAKVVITAAHRARGRGGMCGSLPAGLALSAGRASAARQALPAASPPRDAARPNPEAVAGVVVKAVATVLHTTTPLTPATPTGATSAPLRSEGRAR